MYRYQPESHTAKVWGIRPPVGDTGHGTAPARGDTPASCRATSTIWRDSKSKVSGQAQGARAPATRRPVSASGPTDVAGEPRRASVVPTTTSLIPNRRGRYPWPRRGPRSYRARREPNPRQTAGLRPGAAQGPSQPHRPGCLPGPPAGVAVGDLSLRDGPDDELAPAQRPEGPRLAQGIDPDRLPVLNRHRLCRGQSGRVEGREAGRSSPLCVERAFHRPREAGPRLHRGGVLDARRGGRRVEDGPATAAGRGGAGRTGCHRGVGEPPGPHKPGPRGASDGLL